MAFQRQRNKKGNTTDKKVAKCVIGPFFETADIDTSDNAFPVESEQPNRFQLFKQGGGKALNPMQRAARNNGGVVPWA